MKKNLILMFVGLVVVFAGTLYFFPQVRYIPKVSHQNTPVSEGKDLVSWGQEILQQMYEYQGIGERLAGYVGEDGLTFLPYPHSPHHFNDPYQHFSADALKDLDLSTETLLWGIWDGSGDEIWLSFEEYYQRFMYDEDYLQAPFILTGSEVGSRGNTLMELDTLFSGAQVIEYHFSGFDPEYQGLDWKSLYIVFVPEGEALVLRAIAHGQWTI